MQPDYNIIMAGNPVLKAIAVPVETHEFGSAQLKQFADILIEKMIHLGGVGLAAPQIGVSIRMVAIGVGEHNNRRRSYTLPNQVIINPVIQPQSNEMESAYEFCLSVGELGAKVPRYRHIICTGFDIDGKPIEIEAQDEWARILQHEIDHLDGILFLERVVDQKSFTFYEELKKLSQ